MKYLLFFTLVTFASFISCQRQPKGENQSCIVRESWKSTIVSQLPLLGHRNWILVVDKAFPLQNSNGITTVDTNTDLITVLKFTLDQIQRSSHVKPMIFTDKELNFIGREQVPEIDNFKKSLFDIIGNSDTQVLLHDSVFVKIDKASKLFNVMILKTNQTIPYSSVFIQLDCKYWSIDKEEQLHKNISADLNCFRHK